VGSARPIKLGRTLSLDANRGFLFRSHSRICETDLAELWRRVGQRAGTTRPRFSFADWAGRHRGNLAGCARGPGPTPSPSAPDEGRGHTTLLLALHYSHCTIRTVCDHHLSSWHRHPDPLPTAERETGAAREASSRHSKAAGQVSNQRLCLRPPDVPFSGRHPSGVGRYGFRVPPFRSKKGNARSDRQRICVTRAVAQTAFLWRSMGQVVRGHSRLKCRSESA
jgi:hypothetical protein